MSQNNRLGIAVLAAVTFAAGIFYFMTDMASCTVKGSGVRGVNGYYFAKDGLFITRGYYSGRTLLDFFDVVNIRQVISLKYTLGLTPAGWMLLDVDKQHVIYESLAPDAKSGTDLPLYRPPVTGWMQVMYDEQGKPRGGVPAEDLSIVCSGNLYDAKPEAPPSNLMIAYQEMGTYVILGGIVYYAWYLYTNGVDVGAVSYSYNKVVNEAEYWRGITASFSHFDLMHLGFNGMTLYQMAILEVDMGTLKYLYLSADLVVITMALCTAMYWIMIFKMGREEQLHQQAVGYSCVLFAWIVVVALNLNQFCPIFFLPEFCFDTYSVPFIGLPLNLGPIVLLVITKFILPRSSFVGHLSGIIIGMPLSWGWLDWLTPPVLISTLLGLWMYSQDLDVRNFAAFRRVDSGSNAHYGGGSWFTGVGSSAQYSQVPQSSHHDEGGSSSSPSSSLGGESSSSPLQSLSELFWGLTVLLRDSERELLEEVVVSEVVSRYFSLKRACVAAIVCSTVVTLYAFVGLLPSFSFSAIDVNASASASASATTAAENKDPPAFLVAAGILLTRALLVALAWSSPHAKRITILSDNSTTIKDSLLVIILSSCYAGLLFILDFSSLLACLASAGMVDSAVGGSWGGQPALCIVLGVAVVVEAWMCYAAAACIGSSPPVELQEALRITGTKALFSPLQQ